jgi:uncharacterized membrane protein
MESHVDGLAFPVIVDQLGKQQLIGMPMFITDPCQAGDSPLKTATVRQSPGDALVSANTTVLFTAALSYAFNGTTLDRIRTGSALDGVTGSQALSTQNSRVAVTFGATGIASAAQTSLPDIMNGSARVVSATNTSSTVLAEMRNLSTVLSINMVTSAGTATLTISSSTDNSNFLTIDSIAAAASTQKIYGATTAGATTAIAPMAYRFVKIVAGAAGVGNTTTLDIGVK